MITKRYVDDLGFIIIGAAIEVHKALGPGLLESVYSKCLEQELRIRGLRFEREKKLGISYKGIDLDSELRCDFIIEDMIVIEVKAVQEIIPLFHAQLLTYMQMLKAPKGILINFNCSNIFRQGQKTMVNEMYRNLPL